MTRFLHNTAMAIALGLSLASPAHAQLAPGGLGGGLGGAIGGGLGGGFGGGPGGDIGRGLPVGGSGDIGASGTIERSTRSVRTNAHASEAVRSAVKAPALTVPAVNVASRLTVVPALPAVRRVAVVPAINRLVVVPAIPDLDERRVAIIHSGIAPISYAEVPAYIDQQYGVLQDELRGTGVQVERHGQQIVLEMPSDVTFAFNKHDIQPRFVGVLGAVSRTLAKYPASYVDVDGHTDAIGSVAYNQVLSEQRAGTVAEFLSVRQVNPARLHVQGFGKTEPIASNATINGRAANRRVEIVLTPYAS